MKKALHLILFFLTITTYSQLATQPNNDFETWTALALDYKLNEKWSINLEEQLRLKNNATTINKYFTQIEGKYTKPKNFEYGIGIRYSRKNDNIGNIQNYENHLRLHLQAAFKFKANRFGFKYRMRYQHKNELGKSKAEGDYPSKYFRVKTTFAYNIKKWKLDPKVSIEVFRHNQIGALSGSTKHRLSLETTYKLKKIGTINLAYIREKQSKIWNPKKRRIVKLTYTHHLKKK